VLLIGKCDRVGESKSNSPEIEKSALNSYLENALVPVQARIDYLNGVTLNSGPGKTTKLPYLCCDLLLGPGAVDRLSRGAPLNTDDRLITEYALASQMIGRDDNVEANLQWLSSK
jgi:hypothetical protein